MRKDGQLGKDNKRNKTAGNLNQQNQSNFKWQEAKSKVFDFSQIKGDFVNMLEL